MLSVELSQLSQRSPLDFQRMDSLVRTPSSPVVDSSEFKFLRHKK